MRLALFAVALLSVPTVPQALAQQSELYRPLRQAPVVQPSDADVPQRAPATAEQAAELTADATSDESRRYGGVALAPPQDRADAIRTSPTSLRAFGTTASSLAVVLAVFGLGAYAYRRYARPGGTAPQPAALQVLTRLPLGNRQSLALVRCGKRLLLVGLSPGGPRTLAEFSDADEINRLVSSIGRGRDFHQTLTALAADDHQGDFDVASTPALAAMRHR